MPKAMIHVKDGAIKVTPDPLKVNRRTGERAEWQCDEGRFEVEFKGNSPFVKGKYGGSKGQSEKSGPCKSSAPLGNYPYSVKVWIGENPIVVDPGVEVWDDGPDGKDR